MHNSIRWVLAGSICIGVPSVAASQSAAPAAMASTKIITLGTAGGPLPRKDRAQASNLIVINGTPYLIDAGGGVTQRIVQSGHDFRKIGKIFITHGHSDHVSGLTTLLVSQWEYQRAEPVDIYGSDAASLVKGALAFLAPNAEIRWLEGKKRAMADTFRGHEVAPGVVYQDSNVKVTAVENSHFNAPPDGHARKHKSYSYRFDTPHRSVVFTGDTGPSDAVTQLAKGADVLVSEVSSPEDLVALFKKNGVWDAKTRDEQEGFLRHIREEHVSPEDVGLMAAKAGVKTVILTHFGPTVDPNDDYARRGDGVKKHFSGQVMVARDLMEF